VLHISSKVAITERLPWGDNKTGDMIFKHGDSGFKVSYSFIHLLWLAFRKKLKCKKKRIFLEEILNLKLLNNLLI